VIGFGLRLSGLEKKHPTKGIDYPIVVNEQACQHCRA
jgi:hypothetical protein